ncbi:1,4-dihydroxy-2-naphthoate octaprenyltransferase [Zobellella denitrificans]|uniref:1,4-dihydroxy-2-naphthoate octaprenyltransferase n=1 Tax=Zobellella iuensis TaxID=2803811 RepID=A0ABS1QMZ4_9GAMM|nr:1,4-dihydroxy-2-naphthoate octaprenyltransferase [Zobellella iuensis]MBL1376227.1 1,4-dihydroxy-2-naphthoate octaprenyltransferase [Zobellella iuensis]
MPLSTWLNAIRPKTLPLALASILLGAGVAAGEGAFDGGVLLLALLTALLLQILSNLANDYGDGVRGTDAEGRAGPARVLASGLATPAQLRSAIRLTAGLAALSGLLLLGRALGADRGAWLGFLLLGALALLAALGYTLGRRPYGYRGLGDLAVFVFFGPVAVLGTSWLMLHQPGAGAGWAALVAGLLSVAVLNINNIRDLESDRRAGKHTLALRLGLARARVYQLLLLATALLAGTQLMAGWGFLALLGLWPLAGATRLVLTEQGPALNRALGLTARGTLIFTGLLALGLAWG